VAIIEIRTYRLVPGTRDDFLRVMREVALPLLGEHGITVVRFGPSLVDEDGFEEAYLVRRFASVEERAALEDAFYGSDAWHKGPREDVVSRIETYHTIVIDVPDEAADLLYQPL
jgi:NIPSNAP